MDDISLAKRRGLGRVRAAALAGVAVAALVIGAPVAFSDSPVPANATVRNLDIDKGYGSRMRADLKIVDVGDFDINPMDIMQTTQATITQTKVISQPRPESPVPLALISTSRANGANSRATMPVSSTPEAM